MALGIALARPDLRVIVCSGDGSLLMNLGTLVTIGAEAPRNLVVLLFDNGVYEVTGAQPTPASAQGRWDNSAVDFTALARASGMTTAPMVRDIASWRKGARELLDTGGPTFVHLGVQVVHGGTAPHAPRSPGGAPARARTFRKTLVELPSKALFSVRQAFIVENAPDFLIAIEGDKVVGCAHLADYAPSLAELRSLAVHPGRQGIGIGRALAAGIEELARRRQYRTLFAVSNDEAFFLRLGYEGRDIPELDRERSAVSKFKGVFGKTLV
jgi:N-acetylglutamate synthase-like GNAT family acetyltransferase